MEDAEERPRTGGWAAGLPGKVAADVFDALDDVWVVSKPVAMPRLSDVMEEGTIVRWLVDEGGLVEVGDDLVEIETDKPTMTYRAESSGVLRRRATEGTTIGLGAPMATIVAETATPGSPSSAGGVRASPAARAAARRLGVRLGEVEGSGPAGRVVLDDVRRAAAATPFTVPPDGGGDDDAADADGDIVVRLTPAQQAVARRMVAAKTVPEFVVERDVRVDAVLAGREQVAQGGFPVPSLNDVFVKAAALALREHPRVNASWREDSIVEHGHVNVGFAVAGADSLLVPVVRDADRLPLASIAWTTSELVRQARAGRLPAAAMRDGTFTITNLGMLGVDAFTAILNPPQAAILAIGGVREEPALRDGELVTRRVLRLRLTCDHRVLYGTDAAAFLADLARFVEAPLALAS